MGVAVEAKEAEAKDLPILQPGRKRTLFLRSRTVASVDCVRSLVSLQALIKNVQKLAKKEREESKTKLKEVIEILEGATSAIAGSWRDFWRTIFLGVQILASR